MSLILDFYLLGILEVCFKIPNTTTLNKLKSSYELVVCGIHKCIGLSLFLFIFSLLSYFITAFYLKAILYK